MFGAVESRGRLDEATCALGENQEKTDRQLYAFINKIIFLVRKWATESCWGEDMGLCEDPVKCHLS